ncbi:MAG: SPASM domain-containing protein [Desulfobacterales bacterium]
MLGISTINIELTSRCNKKCHMCGRRKLEKENLDYESTMGDMEWNTFAKIVEQIEAGMVVQLHWNGEPTLSNFLFAASCTIRGMGAFACMDTNGLLLGKKADDLEHFSSITVSVIQGDSQENYDRQMAQIRFFMETNRFLGFFPQQKINIRALGEIPLSFYQLAGEYGIDIIPRIFHAPEMSRDYQKQVTMPEIGVCLDLLHHPAIDRHGNLFPCVRFNPEGLNCLGNVNEHSIADLLSGEIRTEMIRKHFEGRRNEVPLCNTCHYWGLPTAP